MDRPNRNAIEISKAKSNNRSEKDWNQFSVMFVYIKTRHTRVNSKFNVPKVWRSKLTLFLFDTIFDDWI